MSVKCSRSQFFSPFNGYSASAAVKFTPQSMHFFLTVLEHNWTILSVFSVSNSKCFFVTTIGQTVQYFRRIIIYNLHPSNQMSQVASYITCNSNNGLWANVWWILYITIWEIHSLKKHCLGRRMMLCCARLVFKSTSAWLCPYAPSTLEETDVVYKFINQIYLRLYLFSLPVKIWKIDLG